MKWVLVSNMIELRLYGFGEGTTAYEAFQLDRLTDPDEYARFMLLLSADSMPHPFRSPARSLADRWGLVRRE